MPLTDVAIAQIAQLGSQFEADALDDPAEFVREAHLLSRELPTALQGLLYDFARSGCGVLLLRGLATGPLGNTPTSPVSALTHRTLGARCAAVACADLGNLVGYEPESGGRIIQTMVPVEKDAELQVSTSSIVRLETHTEAAFNFRTRPDFIGLMALRGDPQAATEYLTTTTVLDEMPGRALRALREPVFFTSIDPSFVAGGLNDEDRGPFAVLGEGEDPTIIYDRALIRSDDSAAQRALTCLAELWDSEKQSIALSSGDLLIIDNSRTIHGRSQFHPRFDGGDRWIARLQMASSSTVSRFARNGNSPTIKTVGT